MQPFVRCVRRTNTGPIISQRKLKSAYVFIKEGSKRYLVDPCFCQLTWPVGFQRDVHAQKVNGRPLRRLVRREGICIVVSSWASHTLDALWLALVNGSRAKRQWADDRHHCAC
jgi:hypothetical protein